MKRAIPMLHLTESPLTNTRLINFPQHMWKNKKVSTGEDLSMIPTTSKQDEQSVTVPTEEELKMGPSASKQIEQYETDPEGDAWRGMEASYLEEGGEAPLSLPGAAAGRVEELMGGPEQFDSPDFDAVHYMNRLFPTEQSLAGVEGAAAAAQYRLAAVEADIRRRARAQPVQREAGHRALLDAQRCIAELALQVAEINKKAERSESMVREITSEIKQLDCAKTNLTAAITTLNHLHMLVGGVDRLKAMTQQRQYKEIALPLQAIMEVLQHLECYRDIREIGALSDQVHATRRQLADQIQQDFRLAFTGGKSGLAAQRTLAEACSVLDVLDARVKRDLIAWLVTLQLQEYSLLFAGSQEHAWLPHVERRYAWLKRHLLAFEEGAGAVFPPEWRVSERIAQEFCTLTNHQLSELMAARRSELDVKLLLYAIQKTYNFELLLHKRFVGTELGAPPEPRAADPPAGARPDDKDSRSESDSLEGAAAARAGGSPWLGRIGAAFEPYLSLYIASLSQSLRTTMDGFIQEARSPAADGTGSSAGGAVLSSCADLFLFYKKCLVQCARLSTGEPMRELAGVFQQYLREYAESVLQAALPAAGRPASGPGGMPALVSNLHTLLRDDAPHARYTKQEIAKITSVITTAEYCLETTVHLEQKLKEKVAAGLADRIDLRPEQDLFHKMIGDCIQLLVRDLELACEPALQAMTKISWLHFENVGDQSSYVTQIVMHLKNTVPVLRDNLASSRKYFTQFCIRFASSFIPKFIQNIYKCRPLSTVGAEQLLLDTHMLKTALLELPSIGSEVQRPAPNTYTKVVIKLMTKAEMILKLVMAPLESNLEPFVGQFVALLPECSLSEFHRVLDMKGARLSKNQLAALDALFKEASKSSGDGNN